MVELRDHTKRLLNWQALLVAGREDSLNKKMLLCASLKIRHLIIKHFFKTFLSLIHRKSVPNYTFMTIDFPFRVLKSMEA